MKKIVFLCLFFVVAFQCWSQKISWVSFGDAFNSLYSGNNTKKLMVVVLPSPLIGGLNRSPIFGELTNEWVVNYVNKNYYAVKYDMLSKGETLEIGDETYNSLNMEDNFKLQEKFGLGENDIMLVFYDEMGTFLVGIRFEADQYICRPALRKFEFYLRYVAEDTYKQHETSDEVTRYFDSYKAKYLTDCKD
ncbi:hypothetical protein [Corallibacter sp.]|uniref:hypothetical protein n=1 Tax=Corallibacter sp. TaxID=2038084 RepID=UPI003AB8488F